VIAENGVVAEEYSSVQVAAAAVGAEPENITLAIRTNRRCRGLCWRWKCDEGKPWTPPPRKGCGHFKAVEELDAAGNVIGSWSCAADAARAIGSDVNGICVAIRGAYRHRGRFFRYAGDLSTPAAPIPTSPPRKRTPAAADARPPETLNPVSKEPAMPSTQIKAIVEVDKAGKTIGRWESGAAAAKATGVPQSTISSAARHEREARGRTFRFADEASAKSAPPSPPTPPPRPLTSALAAPALHHGPTMPPSITSAFAAIATMFVGVHGALKLSDVTVENAAPDGSKLTVRVAAIELSAA
jgi:hypothetical protein